MKTPLLYLNRQRRNQQLLYWLSRIVTVYLLHFSLTTVVVAQNKVWDKTIGGNNADNLKITLPTSDGGYILGGTSYSGKSGDKSQASKGKTDFWIVKLKADGSKSWDKTLGGADDDELTALQQTSDGGYILGGTSESGVSGDKTRASKGGQDYWIIKLNASGSKMWDKTFGGSEYDGLTTLQQTNDGGFILGGTSLSGLSGDKTQASRDDTENSEGDYWIVKLNATGNKVWDKTFGGDEWDGLASLQQTSDGGYILGGSSTSEKSGDKTHASKGFTDYWVIKLNASGIKVWDKTLGGEGSEQFTAIHQTSDGSYILGGSSLSDISGDKTEDNRGDSEYIEYPYDYWIVKLKTDGSKLWDKTIGGDEEDKLTSLQQTSDSGFILGGYSRSGISGDKGDDIGGYWVVKLKADGTWLWDKGMGSNSSDEYLSSVRQTSDGGFILGGTSNSGIGGDKSQASKGGNDYWIVKLDNSGKNLNQILTFDPIADKGLNVSSFTLSAKATSGLPVTYSIVSGPASVKGNVITLLGLGTVTVKASQAGNTTYKPAKAVTQTFDVVIPYTLPWDKTIGGSNTDNLTTMISTPDGGYLLGGSSASGKSGDKSENNNWVPTEGGSTTYDYWIVKTDNSGKKVWDKTYGGNDSDYLITMVATPDGGYLLGGYSDSKISGDKTQASKGESDYWVIKIDATGTRLWDKSLGGSAEDKLSAMLLTADGGFLLGGSSSSGKSGDKSQPGKGDIDYWVVKTDENGRKLWDKTYGGSNTDNLAALINTNNGGYLLGGTSASGIGGDKSQAARAFEDYWLIQINADGSKAWDKTFGGIKDFSYDEYCYDEDEENCEIPFGGSHLSALVATPDGGFLLGGSSNATKGAEKSEGNVLTNANGTDIPLNSYWVIKINDKGNKVWDKTYSGVSTYYSVFTDDNYTGNSELKSIVATPDGNFLLAGYSNSEKGRDKSEDNHRDTDNTYNRYDYWVVEVDANGNKLWDKTIGGFRDDLLAVALAGTTGNYILAGTSNSGIGGDKSEVSKNGNYWDSEDYWIVNLKVEELPALSVWDLRYGGLGQEGFTTVIKTSDGGYLSGGYTNSGISGDKTQSSQGKNDYWIVKSDKNGRKLWDKRYGGSSDEYLNRIIQTQDGGYLLAGSSLSGIGGDKTQASRGDRDYWIVKINSTGVKQWDKRFGGSGYDELKKVMQLSTGEYLLAGYSNSPAGGNKSQGSRGGTDFWIIKISSTGSQLWDKRFGGSLNEALGGIVLTSDGGFLLGGSSVSGKTGDKSEVSRGGSDFWLVKVDKNGTKLWDKTYGGSGQDEAYSLGRSNSDFFISGQSDSPAGGDKTRGSQGGLDFWIIKLTNTGSKIWDKRFGGSGADELRASIQTSDGGYLLAGKSFSEKSGNKTQNTHGGLSDYWIVKTDKDGMYQWDKRYGGTGSEELRAVIQTSDGGMLLAGKSDSGVSGDRTQPSQGGFDFWLVKVAPETMPLVATREATEVEEPVTQIEELQLQAYPNPFQDKATIRFSLPETQLATVKVYDLQGREVATLYQGEVKAKQRYEVEWKTNNQAAGIYLLQLQTPTKKHQYKLILAK